MLIQTFAVATFNPLYICMASALIISPSYLLANWIDSFVFPTPSYQLETNRKPVVPTMITAFLRIVCSIPVEINFTDLEFMIKMVNPDNLNSKNRVHIKKSLDFVNMSQKDQEAVLLVEDAKSTKRVNLCMIIWGVVDVVVFALCLFGVVYYGMGKRFNGAVRNKLQFNSNGEFTIVQVRYCNPSINS